MLVTQVRKSREEAGLSQQELADRSGMTLEDVIRLEKEEEEARQIAWLLQYDEAFRRLFYEKQQQYQRELHESS